MAKIEKVEKRISADGNVFTSIGLVQFSTHTSETGKVSLVARRANITSNISPDLLQDQIGLDLPGNIVKVDCQPYDWVNPSTGEVVKLAHTYTFQPA